MGLYQKTLGFLLWFSLLSLLIGCSRTDTGLSPTDTVSAETESFAPEATQTSADIYLQTAQGFIDNQDLTSAISVLEQALEETEDPRLQAMLEELTAPTPLVLEFTNDFPEAVTVRSFTAEESYTHKVRYTLNYTAPEGLTVQLSGSQLSHPLPDFSTTGQPGQLVFEADAEDIRNMNGTLQVRFLSPEGTAYTVEAKVFWPDHFQSSYEISYLHMDHNRTENAQVHSFLLADMGENYHFTVSYTAREGLEITGLFETPEEAYAFWEEPLYTDGSEGSLEFDIPKDLFANGKYMEVCFTDANGQWVAAGFDFPMHLHRTLETPQEKLHPLSILPSSGWGSGYEIHDCFYQRMDNGFVRFTLDISAPAGCFVTVSAEQGTEYEMLDQYLSLPERQQYVFDVPEATLAKSRSLSVLVAQPFSSGRYFEIPCGDFAASSAAMPTAEATALEFMVMDRPYDLDCEILSAAVQPLSNGSFRYSLEIRTGEAMKATVFDPPDGETVFCLFLSEPAEGIHTFSLDVEAAVATRLSVLTLIGAFSGNQTFSAAFQNPIKDLPLESIPITVHTCS